MASPDIAETNTSAQTTETDSHTVSLTATRTEGHLQILGFAIQIDTPITWPGGWAKIGSDVIRTTQMRLSVAYKVLGASEPATITVTTGSAAKKSAHWAYRITGFKAGAAPEKDGDASGASAAPNPGLATPAGGEDDYLWVATYGLANNSVASGYPANYTLGQASVATGGGNSCGIGVAARKLTASSEDPGAFSTVDDDWAATVLIVSPAASTVGRGNLDGKNLSPTKLVGGPTLVLLKRPSLVAPARRLMIPTRRLA